MKPRIKKPLSERFWPKVNKTETCWLWTAATHDFGYGLIGCPDRRGRTLRAHRVSYEWSFGKIPDGLHVLHRCDIPACVNPDHLFLGTDQDNVTDMINKGRFAANGNGAGEEGPNSKMTWRKVREIRRLVSSGMSHKSVANKFDIDRSTVGQIVNFKTWKNGDSNENCGNSNS